MLGGKGSQNGQFWRETTSTSYPDKRWSSLAKGSGGDAAVGSAVTSVLLVLVSLHRYGNLGLMPRDSSPALVSLAPKRKLVHCARLAFVVMACITETSRGVPCLDLSAPVVMAAPEEVLHHPPREAWPLARVLSVG